MINFRIIFKIIHIIKNKFKKLKLILPKYDKNIDIRTY